MCGEMVRSRRRGCFQREILAGQVQVILKHGNDEIVIVALREPGDGDCANASRAREENREAPAVWSVVFQIETCFRLQSGLSALMRQADGVGAAVIALDDVAFAANPVPVVRSGAGHGVRK